MSGKTTKKYFEILELDSGASFSEIKNAYIRLKRLYSTDSMVITPIADEFSKKKRLAVLRQIEEAFTGLKEELKDEHQKSTNLRKPGTASENGSEGEEVDSLLFSGDVLRQIREKRGIHLFEVALDTKIRAGILENIEHERFDALPQEVYLKGHVSNYARYLLLDPRKVADDYISRYKAWKADAKEKV
jgi:curved DNA-binding protein CbpA